ncbi:cyclic nucleotide-binding domain-containing protein [Paracoccus laeviglucosivorans]|uniref:Cyclic nucleotide-binding domain-containing protein n=1 Tax=Paracoccus laeviglucosivorans TaxID=1197861 RepID=A0A521D2N8_9RHOB|nr:cyclic nucleotide-binding domain-containing protein [Paracoccus laeviglucosivorans]SMO65953.1 Cyclic nucleotide-binding domain-containing protein [Paracoccus laeviglucosivorans]
MALNEEVNVLRQVPLFSCLEPLRLKKLAFASQRMHYDPTEVLFQQGDDADKAYILISGRAEILADGASGDIRIAELPPGSIVGEVALLCGGLRTATVRALEPLDVLAIEPQDFLAVLSEDRGACVRMMRVLAQRLAVTTSDLIAARAELAQSQDGSAT